MPLLVAIVALVAFIAWRGSQAVNVRALLALLRHLEANGRYDVIAGYPAHADAVFTDWSEHPYVLDPHRERYIGTTASGAYQQVRATWSMARDALGLTNFSPSSQDRAAEWIIKYKVPGQNVINPEGTGNYELIVAGDFADALSALAPEWESLQKILAGEYHVTLAQAQDFYTTQGGTIA